VGVEQRGLDLLVVGVVGRARLDEVLAPRMSPATATDLVRVGALALV
jgi:hypothetical protein